jgi:hypothetical protein
MLTAHKQFVTGTLAKQSIRGSIKFRFFGRAVDPTKPATWAVTARVVSRECDEERGIILPMTIGTKEDLFGPDFRPYIIGPFPLTPIDINRGDRMVFELGSQGPAQIETRDDGQTWCEISSDIDILFEESPITPVLTKRSKRIGHCIYCMRDDVSLSREHIIPYGLNGELTLLRASCKECQDVTSAIETDVLRNMFGTARIALDMRSRNAALRPTNLPLTVTRGHQKETIQIPAERFPAIMVFPIFPPPAHLSGDPYTSGINPKELVLRRVARRPIGNPFQENKFEYIDLARIEFDPVKFARMIAKIAYGFVVLNLGVGRIKNNFIMPALFGRTNDIGKWVGTGTNPFGSPTSGLHVITIAEAKNGEVHVFVRLFAQFNAPEYLVIVGSLN